MSQTQPMTAERREARGDIWTPRQHRQYMRMATREYYRVVGSLPQSGASGERIRRPLEFVSKAPERGSIRTHIAAYCAPCDVHGGHKAPWDPTARPRLHRYPVGAR